MTINTSSDKQIIAGGGWGGDGLKGRKGMTWDEMRKAFPVVKPAPVFTYDAGGNPHQIPDRKAIVRVDNGECVSIMGAGYALRQYEAQFHDPVTALGAAGAIYSSGGTFKGGRVGWVSCLLPGGESEVVRGDVVKGYLNLYTSIDGSLAWIGKVQSERPICENTYARLLATEEKVQARAKHTSGFDQALSLATDELRRAGVTFRTYVESARIMAQTRFTDTEMISLTEILIPSGPDVSKRTANARETLSALFEGGKGITAAIRGTRWAAWNAVTEYVDHHRSTRVADGETEDSARTFSAWLGSGSEIKDRAYAILTQ